MTLSEYTGALQNAHSPVKGLAQTRSVNSVAIDAFSQRFKFPAPRPIVEWLLATREIERIVDAGRAEAPEHFFDGALRSMDVLYACSDGDLRRIPKAGPALIVCNHPFGMLEGLLMGSLLEKIRPDYMFIANGLLSSIPEIGRRVLPVDPFGDPSTVQQNGQSLRKAYRWLQQGGLLVTFPAGEVSNLQGTPPAIVDSTWNTLLVRMARRAGAPVVPAFFHGRNSIPFQIAGLVHPALRTALLCRELINKRGGRFTISIGAPVQPARLAEFATDEDVTQYVRERTYALQHRRCVPRRMPEKAPAVIVGAQCPDALEADIAALKPEALLFSKGDYRAYCASAAELPHVLREIGRLREISFRAAGEGTGKAVDLDRFDDYYDHLFLWRVSSREVVGAYRVAEVDRVLDAHGPKGLYTHTLFSFDDDFLQRLRLGLELGRSFIRPEYQRNIHSLHYLWKAIGAYLSRSPRRYLFGPVSISEDYSEAARKLIVAYFEERRTEKVVRPRCEFRSRGFRDIETLAREARSLSDLCELIGDLQADGKEIPVLLRHYLNLGGEVLGFNVDREFSNALDGLLMVDLEKGNPEVLDRYLGRKGVRLNGEFDLPR